MPALGRQSDILRSPGPRYSEVPGPPDNLTPVDRGCQVDPQGTSLTQHEQHAPAALPWECPVLTSGVSLHLLPGQTLGPRSSTV